MVLAWIAPGMHSAEAATYYWANWNSYNFDGTTHTLTGTITTGGGDTVTVTYTNTQGLAGYQLADGTGGADNYYSGGTDGGTGTSPYTSPTVENRPDNVTIVRLSNAGTQTLTFSKSVANLAFAFVSLNGNAFSFDRNFDILSYGDPSDGGNACGYWGCGTATKAVTSGSYPYVVNGTGEPHGTLRFSGAFSALTWTSGNESWHGFTVGIAGTASEVVTSTAGPTVVFNPADKTTNIAVGTNITITFSEEVRNLNDTPLNNTNVDSLITLKNSNASGANIPFDATIDAANKVITINPTSDFTNDQIIYAAIGATVENTYGNAIVATSATITTGSSLSTYDDPRAKKDVVGNIAAWSGLAERWAQANLTSISDRLDWLRRNKNTLDKSHHGAQIKVANPVVDGLLRAATSKNNPFVYADAGNLIQKYFQGHGETLSDVTYALAGAAFLQLSQASQPELEGVHAASSESNLFGSWSWWTQGEAAFGKVNGSALTSEQRANDYHLYVGADRPMHENGIVGFSFGHGKSDTNVGSVGSGVGSTNYSVSGYATYMLPSLQTVEAMLGFGHMQMDIERIDGSQNLAGKRNANQIFGSVALRGESLRYGNFSTSPYGRLEASHTKLDGFSETGGDLALIFARQTLNTTMVLVGANVEYETNMGGGQLRPYGKFEYGANVSHSSNVDMRYVAESTDYRLTLAKRATSYLKMGIGFDYKIKNGASVVFEYLRTQAINSGVLNGLKLQLGIPF